MRRNITPIIFLCLSLLFLLNSCELFHTCEAGEWQILTEPTCELEGMRIKTCTTCNIAMETELIPKLQHSYGNPWYEEYDDGTGCKEWIYQKACEVCGYVEIINRVKNHDYKRVTTRSTCTTYGYDTITCQTCGDVKIEHHTTLAPHIYNEKEYLSDGNHHWHKCKNCDNLSERVEHTEDESGICTLCQTRVAYTDGVVYQLSADRSYAIVTGYSGSNRRVRIMPEYEGVPVTHIGNAAFKDCWELFSVSLTDNITYIGNEAFSDCPYLVNVWHLGNVMHIGDNAFKRNFILKITTLPENLEYIGESAFSECGEITISVIPDSVSYMGSNAFYHCNRIKSVKIGSSLTEIKDKTFASCYNLGAVELGENLLTIGNHAFEECYYIEALVFPDSLVSIGEDSFTHCNRLKSVHLGKSFTTIGSRAFNECFELNEISANSENPHFTCVDGIAYAKDLSTLIYYPSGRKDENLTLPEGVKTILDYAFYGMGYIKNLTLPTTLTDIGVGAFRDCKNLESVTILGSTKIGDYAFAGCTRLSDLQLSDSVSAIGEFAFQDGGFVELVIPDSVTSMGMWAFSSCYYLEKVTIGSGLKNIPEGAFIYCGSYLNTVIISDGVETIGENAFAYCYDLEYLSIADSVKSIGKNAFMECASLTTVVMGEGLLEIGEGAFVRNDSLKTVYYKGTSDSWSKINIADKNSSIRSSAVKYYYSEDKPDNEGKYWHYDENGNAVIWSE